MHRCGNNPFLGPVTGFPVTGPTNRQEAIARGCRLSGYPETRDPKAPGRSSARRQTKRPTR